MVNRVPLKFRRAQMLNDKRTLCVYIQLAPVLADGE